VSQVKVGDVVAWAEVPSGAFVETSGGGRFFVRVGNQRLLAKVPGDKSWGTDTWGPWNDRFATSGTIIALGLTGQETAAELQRLAEVYKVREAWLAMPPVEIARITSLLVAYADAGAASAFDDFYRRLHAAGWRPGMTAEDAARLLAEVQS